VIAPKPPIFLCTADRLIIFDSVQAVEKYFAELEFDGSSVSLYDVTGLRLTFLMVQQPNPGRLMTRKIQLIAGETWPTHMPALDAALRHFLIRLHGYSPAWLANVPTGQVLELALNCHSEAA